jgi:hypothetical protein
MCLLSVPPEHITNCKTSLHPVDRPGVVMLALCGVEAR